MRAGTALALCCVCSLSLALPARAGGTLPTGGQFVAGQGTIAGSGPSLTVTQSSSHGIVNWQTFSVGQGGNVYFNNGQGATLNRVVGGNLSQIDGNLHATGSVYLINPQGIVIGPGGRVMTNGSFVLSTRDVSNNAFMSGGAFAAGGTSNGAVINEGVITSNTGDAILVGSSVSNSGTVSAPNGTVGMAAGNEILLQPAGGDARIQISGGSGSVTNTGNVKAAQAELNSAGGNVYALVENNGGGISASGTKNVSGHIWLTAGGTATVTSTITATDANGSGGDVTVRANDIQLPGTIDASATQAGQAGGSVSVVAENSDTITGTIMAQGYGSARGGNVETSGHLLFVDGAHVDAGQGGNWLLDPYDLTVDTAAATGIDNSLNAGTNVTLKTTATGTSGPGNANASGNGDIFIDSALGWSTSATLTLDAYRSINVLAPITVSGAGGVILKTNDGGTGGGLSFGLASSGFAGNIAYTGAPNSGQSLAINGTDYTLLYSMSGVQSINNSNATLGGNYALAISLNASGTSGWTPIGTDGAGDIGNSGNGFTGAFEGLGNTISNLTLSAPSTNYLGLFGYSSGSLGDIGILGSTVSGYSEVGSLAGANSGAIANAYSSATVTGNNEIGGLVGGSDGSITGSHAAGQVSGYGTGPTCCNGGMIGGLVGLSEGPITNSYATGDVSGIYDTGGLVGANENSISNDYATATVSSTGGAGGLAGFNSGTITDSYAAGSVSGGTTAGGGNSNSVGGLVGYDEDGTITQSFSTGAVAAGSASQAAGGLIGWANDTALSQSYAAGAVLSSGQYAGGLVGYAQGASIARVYTIGAVVGSDNPGGLVGENFSSTFSYAYWDTQTNGQSVGVGVDNNGQSANVTARTTAQLQGALPSGFSSSVWGTGTGLYPYFLWQFPSGTPQAIAGTAYNSNDVAIAATQIAIYADGSLLTGGTVSSGANGAFYELEAPGSVTASTKLGETITLSGASSASGMAYTDQPALTGSNFVGFNVTPGTLAETTGEANQPGLNADVSSTLGPGAYATIAAIVPDSLLSIRATNPGGFTITQSLVLSGFILDSTQGITINAPVTISGAGWVALTTNDGGSGGSLSFGLTSSGFAGNISFTGTPDSGEVLLINGVGYTLLYSMSDLQNINASAATLEGNYALANSLDASGTSNWTPIGTDGAGHVDGPSDGFAGLFEGLGHTISNLAIDLPGVSNVGLFGVSGTISDVGILGGSVIGGGSTGGLVGSSNGPINNSFVTATVSGTASVGGLAGDSGKPISNSYATGSVSANSYSGGLVGYNTGAISNSHATGAVNGSYADGGLVGYNNGAMIGNSYATGAVNASAAATVFGGLVGYNSGTITDSYATGAVTGVNESVDVGGLVGENSGMIDSSYATGPVTAPMNTTYVGGLVGDNSNGSIIDSFATGAVEGYSDVGGLAGANFASTIADSYAIGSVSGFSSVGGLIGFYPGTVTNGYWDTQTSGQSTSAAGTGLTTAQMQGPLPNGFSSTAWGTGPGLYPYLLWQYPGGTPQSVSGIAYSDSGVTPLISNGSGAQYVNAMVGGASIGSVSTGADGSYYFLLAPGTLSASGTPVLAYTTGANGGASVENATGTVGSFAVWGKTLIAPTADTTYSSASATSLQTQDSALISTATGTNTAAQTLIAGLTNYGYIGTGASFTIDTTETPSNGLFAETTAADAPLTVNGAVSTSAGSIALSTAGSGSNIVINDPLSTPDSVILNASGAVYQASNAPVSANGLTGSAGGVVSLVASNQIADLDAFADTGSLFSLTDAETLTVNGTVGDSGGALTLTTTGSSSNNIILNQPLSASGTVTLTSAGSVYQASAATITAAALTGSATGVVSLVAPNQITSLYSFTDTGSSFSLTNAALFEVNVPLDVPNGSITLTTTGSGHDLQLNEPVTASGQVTLTSAGAIYQSSTGVITAPILTGSAAGVVSLVAPNAVTSLYTFTAGGSSFLLDDAETLEINVPLDIANGSVALTTTGAGHDIQLNDPVTAAGQVTLTSAGAIYQASAGVITAPILTGSAAGNVSLVAPNVVTSLYSFTTGGSSFSLDDAETLEINVPLDIANGSVTLTTTGASHDIQLNDSVTASGQVTLNSAGSIYQSPTGVTTAPILTGSASGTVSLVAPNAISNLYTFTAGGTSFALTDAGTLTVNVPLSLTASGAGITLTTTGNGHNIVLNDSLTAPGTVTLDSAGAIYQAGAGIVTANILTGSADGVVNLVASNDLANLSSFTTGGSNLTLDNAAALSVIGSVNTGSDDLTLTTTGSGNNLAIDASVTGATINLNSSGNATETSSGAIIANLLNVTANTGISLTSSLNNITTLGTDTTQSGPNNVHM